MKNIKIVLIAITMAFLNVGCAGTNISEATINTAQTDVETIVGSEYQPSEYEINEESVTLSDVPAYTGNPFIEVNDNIPFFSSSDNGTDSFETYSELDALGRCGVAYANIGIDLMPTEDRGNIGQIKPSGWHTVKYDCVDGKYLYNRCHLIGFQLTAENANEKNLITGTRYMNVDGMLPFENMVADYIKETENHVLYRVTPLYEEDNLLADGVLMEAKSVEDDGAGILYNVFVYNVQPGVSIDYATGESSLYDSTLNPVKDSAAEDHKIEQIDYILNTNSKKFHKTSCSSVEKIKDENRNEYTGNRSELISQGYSPCGICKP